MRPCATAVSRLFGPQVRNSNTVCVTSSPFFRTGPVYVCQIPGNAPSGRPSSPAIILCQTQSAGRCPNGSQYEVKGTTQRRALNDGIQNRFVDTWSSRQFPVLSGAFPRGRRTKPQCPLTSSRSPSSATRINGASLPGKIAAFGSNHAVRFSRSPKRIITAMRLLWCAYKLQMANLP